MAIFFPLQGHLAREVGEKTKKKEGEAPPSLFLMCKARTEQQHNTPDVTFVGCSCRRKSVIGAADEGERGGREQTQDSERPLSSYFIYLNLEAIHDFIMLKSRIAVKDKLHFLFFCLIKFRSGT